MRKSVKTIVMMGFFLSLAQIGFAQTYVVPTLGGSELVPIIQDQLDSLPNGGRVSEYQGKLIITTTPANYQAVQSVIHQIDQLPQTLTVAVRVGENSSNYQHTGYGNVGVTNSRVWVNGQWQNSQTQTMGNQLYQIQTLSGKPASIGLEQLIATPTVIVNNRRNYSQNRPQIVIGTTLLSANQGIIVIPNKLANGQIQVQIAQSNERFGSFNRQTVVNGQNLATSVTLYPNQWTTIGYVNNTSQNSNNYGGSSQNLQTPIQIMVQ